MLKELLSLISVTVLINQCKQEMTKHDGLFPPAPASCKSYVEGDSIIESRLPAEYTFSDILHNHENMTGILMN